MSRSDLVEKIHEAMKGHKGQERFEALLVVLAAGIVAYSDNEVSEASIYGCAVRDLAACVDDAREQFPYKEEADGEENVQPE